MFKFNTFLKTKGGLTAVILTEVFQSREGSQKNLYIGYIEASDGLIFPTRWLEDGTNEANQNHSLVQPIHQFGIGEWQIQDDDRIAVVTTISPHESSQYRLIGYIKDQKGRMYPACWSHKGRCNDQVNHLNRYSNLSKPTF